MKKPKACLFDLDGVLIDSEPLHGKAWKKTASFFNKELTNAQLNLLKGRTRLNCGQQLIEWIDESIDLEEVLAIHSPISKNLIKEAKAMPGAAELVLWCYKEKLPIALVTSSSEESVQNKSNPHSWMKVFSTKVHGDDPLLSAGKPSPEPYLLAAKKLNVNPSSCWAIEDSISGTKSALNAGCMVWVLNKQKTNHSKNVNPIYIKELKDILITLEEIN